jgi:tetratricopeptide (TPR) repeat protein
MYHLSKICLVILLGFPSLQNSKFNSTQAQQPNRARLPKQETAVDKAQPAEQKRPDYSQEAFVIEQYRISYRFESDGTGQREMSARVRIQSEAGVQTFGQLILPYNSSNEKIEIEQVSVHKQDGSTVTASQSNIQELTAPVSQVAPVYSDLKAKHVTVPSLRPGDSLDYHVIWRTTTPLAPNHFWLEHNFIVSGAIVLDERLEISIPQAKAVKLKVEPGLDPTIIEENGRRIYSWKHASLKREEKNDKKTAKIAEPLKTSESDEPKPPQVQMTTFKGWDEVGQWYADLQRDRIVPDDKIRAKVAEQTRGLNSDADKIKALYGYVAKNFRYVSLSFGQGRYQPHAATEILASEYGDCKDKHTLLAAMLLAAGIHAYPALINTTHKIDPDIPSPAQFDHCITAIPLGKETIWVDTTTEVAPFRLLMPPLRKKLALVIPDNGPARLETTPADPPFPSTQSVDIEGKIDDKGELIGRAHATLRGDAELLLRILFRRTPKAEWKNLRYYLTLSVGLGYEAEITEIRPGDPNATEKPFELEYDFTIKDFLDWTSKTDDLDLPLPSFHLPEAGADDEQRSKPIDFESTGDMTFRLKLPLPAKYHLRLPVPITVVRDYAEYRSTYKLEANTLIAERSLRVRQREIPASRLQDYVNFLNSTKADAKQVVSVKTDVAATPSLPDSVTSEELMKAATRAEEDEDYIRAEELFKRVVAREPKHKTAHGHLGYVLLELGKLDPAIEELREQTKINPFDEFAYAILARVFWAQSKYEEAEASYHKQIEVTPLSKTAHGELGLMQVDWKKYKEAVPELEQAIALNPDEATRYEIGLGRAYLSLGQSEKAIAAFDHALNVSHEASTLNNIAYNLADESVQLDKAQQYSQEAVKEVETNLRNAKLEELTMDDLVSVRSLATYWDTLGWIHFKKGNLDLAEKYMTAAWQVEQYSEVGDHLGQISEKRGKKEEAIRWYTLAAAGTHPTHAAHENLKRLSGPDKLEQRINKAQQELVEFRTIKLGQLLKGEKEKLQAEFYVVLVPGETGKPKVAEVKFIRGSEKLRGVASALQSATYGMSFPDETTTKIIRRGVLMYEPTSEGCTFILLSPEYVTSVD